MPTEATSLAMNDWRSLLASSSLTKGTKLDNGKVISGTRRLANATTIVEEFLAAGLPLSLALAAVTNANAESRLDNTAMGDFSDSDGVYHSVGLFQINDLKGRRKFSGDRTDPVYASRWILEEYKAHEDDTSQIEFSTKDRVYAESLESALQRGASVAELAGLFGFHVERPKYLEARKEEREAMARKLFPTVASLPGSSVDLLAPSNQRQDDQSSFLSSASAVIWSPIQAVSDFFTPATTGTFQISDNRDYALADARGELHGPGEVAPGSYTVTYQGKTLKSAKGAPLKLEVEAGASYEAKDFVVRRV